MSGGGVFRMICVALLAAPLTWIAAAGAQQPDTSKPGDAPPSAGTPPPPVPDLKSTLGRAPKDVPLIDPCKSQHAPSYCNVKD